MQRRVQQLDRPISDALHFNNSVGLTFEHLHSSFSQPNEDTIVDLQEAEKLEGLALLGVNLVDALYPDDECQLGLLGDVEAIVPLGITREPDPLPLDEN